MSHPQNNIEDLIAGGILGAAFGALLSKDKEEGALIGALLGAAIAATVKASEEAKKINVFEEEKNRKYAKANAALKAKLDFIEQKYDYTSSAK